MKTVLTVTLVLIGIGWGITTCVDVANSDESGNWINKEMSRQWDDAQFTVNKHAVYCMWTNGGRPAVSCVSAGRVGAR